MTRPIRGSIFRTAVPVLALALLAGCSLRSIAVRSAAEILPRGIAAFYEEPDPALAREAMGSQLKLVEVLLKNDPGNPELLLAAAQGFGGYAFLFLEDEAPDRAKRIYARGRDFGIRALGKVLPARFDREPDLGKFSAMLGKVGKRDAGLLFWTAYAWGGWADLSRNDPQALADLPKVEAMMRRVEELSPGYFFGGPDLFFGAYYGSRPRILGGDPEKSRSHFERAVAASDGKFLMARVLYAQFYGVPSGDRELFRRSLEAALAGSPADLPEQRLANEVARIRARKLLEAIDELF